MVHKPICFNTCNNTNNYRQRAQTLQPIRGGGSGVIATGCAPGAGALSQYSNDNVLRYLISHVKPADSDRSNYANVPKQQNNVGPDATALASPPPHHPHSPSKQQNNNHHTRSHSHHHYHVTCQNDLNNYYNLTNGRTSRAAIVSNSGGPTKTRYLSHIHEHQTPAPHQAPVQMNSLAVMQVCAELNWIDSSPLIPEPRSYTVSPSNEDNGLYKIKFPQHRYMKTVCTDPRTGVRIPAGSSIVVMGPSEENRANLSVRYNGWCLDIPHQYTIAPQPQVTQQVRSLTTPCHCN